MGPIPHGAYSLLKEAFNKWLSTIISDSEDSSEKSDMGKHGGAREEWPALRR